MRNQYDDTQNSDAQTPANGCPTCGESIQSVERRGPSEVVVTPCGHDLADTLARNFPRSSRARTDGGETQACDGCGLSDTDVRLVETVDPNGRVSVCTDCEDDLNAEIIGEVSQ